MNYNVMMKVMMIVKQKSNALLDILEWIINVFNGNLFYKISPGYSSYITKNSFFCSNCLFDPTKFAF